MENSQLDPNEGRRASFQFPGLQSNLNRIVFFCLFLLAFGIRAGLVSTARFTSDEAVFYDTAYKIYTGEAYPLLGTALTGGLAKHPGPLFFYFTAISQWVSPTPEAASFWTAFIGSLGVLLFGMGLARWVSRVAAWTVSLLLAVSPWAVFYSDRIWNFNWVSFWVALAFWSFVQVSKTPRSRWIAVTIVSLAWIPQFHMSAPVIWMTFVFLVASHIRNSGPPYSDARLSRLRDWIKSHVHWKWVGVGLVIAAFGYIPTVIYELKNHFSNLSLILHESMHQRSFAAIRKCLLYSFRFLTLDTSYFELAGYWRALSETETLRAFVKGTEVRPFSLGRLLTMGSSIFFACFGLLAFWKKSKTSEDYRALGQTACVGVVAGIILLGVSGKPFYAHYLHPILPFLFVGYGALAEEIWKGSVQIRWLGFACLMVFCFGALDLSYLISRNLDGKNSLPVQRAILQQILSDQKKEAWDKPATVSLKIDFHSYVESYQVLLKDVYHSDLNIRLDNDPQVRYSARYHLVADGTNGDRWNAESLQVSLKRGGISPNQTMGAVELKMHPVTLIRVVE